MFPDHKGQLKEQIKLFDNTFNYICDQFHQKEKQVYFGRRIHTEENSKAKGYIRNNCETQSTHCIKTQARLITVWMLKTTIFSATHSPFKWRERTEKSSIQHSKWKRKTWQQTGSWTKSELLLKSNSTKNEPLI